MKIIKVFKLIILWIFLALGLVMTFFGTVIAESGTAICGKLGDIYERIQSKKD